MFKNRMINTKFWQDGYIMTQNFYGKLLFLYLLTNPQTNILGIYEIDIRTIIFDTRLRKNKILEILAGFERDNKIKYESGWIAIRNFTKYQKQNPSIIKGINELKKFAPPKLIEWVESDSLLEPVAECDSLSEGVSNPNPNIKFNYREGKFDGITDEYINQLDKLYPGIDIEGEIKKMINWLLDNPNKKRKGKRTFINNWLQRASDSYKEKMDTGIPRLRQGEYKS